MLKAIRTAIEETQATLEKVLADKALLVAVEQAAQACIDALQSGKKIMLCGNGG
jgi:phosphoheptose isomerase